MIASGITNKTKEVHRKEISEILSETRKLFWKNQEKLMEVERHQTIERDLQRLSQKDDRFLELLNLDEQTLGKMEASHLFNLKVKLLAVFDRLENERIEIDRLAMKSAFMNEAKPSSPRKKKIPVQKKLHYIEIRDIHNELPKFHRRTTSLTTPSMPIAFSPDMSPRHGPDRGLNKLSLDLLELSSANPPHHEKVEDQFERLNKMLSQLKEFSDAVAGETQDTQRTISMALQDESSFQRQGKMMVCPHCNKELGARGKELEFEIKDQKELLEQAQMELEDVYSTLLRDNQNSERQNAQNQDYPSFYQSLQDFDKKKHILTGSDVNSLEMASNHVLLRYIYDLQEKLVDQIDSSRRMVDELRKELYQQELISKSLLHEKNALELELDHHISLFTRARATQEKSHQANLATRAELIDMSASINDHYTQVLRICEYNDLLGLRTTFGRDGDPSVNKYDKINKKLIALQKIWEHEENRLPDLRTKSPSRSMSKSFSSLMIPNSKDSTNAALSPVRSGFKGVAFPKHQIDLAFSSIKEETTCTRKSIGVDL